MTGRFLTAALFLLISIPTCLTLAIVTPPGQVPDEPSHMIRAYSVFTGQLLGQHGAMPVPGDHTVPSVGVEIDPSLVHNAFFFHGSEDTQSRKVTAAAVEYFLTLSWEKRRQLYFIPNTMQYFPVFYVPSGAAIVLTRALGGRPWVAILGGRLVNVACFVGLGLATVLLARRGRGLLTALLCLPISLSLAASFNQDGLLVPSACLALVLLERSWGAADPDGLRGGIGNRRCYWLGCAIIAAIGVAKVIYLPLALFTLLPVLRRGGWRWEDWRERLAGFLACILPGLIWAAIALRYVATKFWIPDYAPGPLYKGAQTLFWTTDPSAQLHILLAKPIRFISLPWHSMVAGAMDRALELVGVLGTMDLLLPKWLYATWFVALPLAFLADLLDRPASARQTGWFESLAILAGLLLSVWAIQVTQYLNWTRVGWPEVVGVQGRYVLPLLPALPFLIPAVRVAVVPSLLRVAALAPALCGIVVLPYVVMLRYLIK